MLTQQQIAERVGVSQVAISNALRGTGRMSSERREQILRAIDALGYRPNSSARAIRSKRFGAAGLLFRTDQSFFPLSLIHGITDALTARDMHLAMAELPFSQASDADQYTPKLLREMSVDGFLVHHAVNIPEQTIALIRRQRIPAIWINVKSDWDCVYPDDLRVGRQATEALLAAGHRRIAFVTFADDGPRGHYSATDRRAGYEAAMRDAGLQPRVVAEGVAQRDFGTALDTRPAVARAMLAGPDRPTAVVTLGTSEVFPVLTTAAELGLSVPRDLSVVTIRDREVTETGVAVTTFKHPMEQIGRTAVEMLVQKAESPPDPVPAVAVPFEHPVGATVASPTGRP